MRLNRNLLGVLSLCVGVLVFSTQDAIIKAVSGGYPVTQVVATRCVIALPILALIVHFESGLRSLVTPRFWWLTLRAGILLVSYTTYYLAFPALPLADAVALYFTVPLFVTTLAGPVLGEHVRPSVWLAIIMGFAGVLIMLRPGSGVFEPAAFLSLFSAALYASSMLMARGLGGSEPASVMSFYQNWVYLAGAGLIALVLHGLGIEKASHPSLEFLVRPWVFPQTRDLLLMLSAGVIASIGMVLLTHAYRIAEASLVTAFEYTGLMWAPLWGFLFWGEIPRWTTFAGGALIVAAGLIALRPGAAASSALPVDATTPSGAEGAPPSA